MKTPNVILNDNVRGSSLMLLAMASFAIGDGFLKFISSDIPLSQILVIRGMFAILILGSINFYFGYLSSFRPIFTKPLLLRILGEIGATYFFLTALFNMPIANAAAILQALPLTVTLGAAFWFGEAIGWRRVSAILIGFIGVLLIVQPGLEGFTIYSIYCIIAVGFTTLRDLATRRLDPAIPTFFVSLITVISVTIFGASLSVSQSWQPVAFELIFLLAVASIFLISGFFGIVGAMRVGEVGVVTPFRYFVLLFSLIIGIVIFDEIPDPYMIIGSAIVVGTGLYTIYREQMRARQDQSGALTDANN